MRVGVIFILDYEKKKGGLNRKKDSQNRLPIFIKEMNYLYHAPKINFNIYGTFFFFHKNIFIHL